MLQNFIQDALKEGATDIHLEPYQQHYRVRLRIDGLLHEQTILSQAIAEPLLIQLKVAANLDIAEKRIPQDGRCQLHNTNIRISTCPTLDGEKLVLRLLKKSQDLLKLEQLDFYPEQLQEFKQALNQSQGLILVTGPTGSGKTSTLYAALDYLNTTHRNIVTIEDPVEIQLTGINQVHVNRKAKLDFSTALRAFLRQDPDIIMVGEIRDQETAEIAIRAAQTGHLVLASLHTNSAIETISRLINLGIKPFEISHSLSLMSSQRLLRRLCLHCRRLSPIHEAEKNYFQLKENLCFEAVGCDHCHQGYQGRLALHELVLFDEEIKQLVSDLGDLKKHIKNLHQLAAKRIESGDTSLSELRRVLNF